MKSNVPLSKRRSPIEIPRIDIKARSATAAFLLAQSVAVRLMMAVGSRRGRRVAIFSCEKTHTGDFVAVDDFNLILERSSGTNTLS
jgi:hypothetical protein